MLGPKDIEPAKESPFYGQPSVKKQGSSKKLVLNASKAIEKDRKVILSKMDQMRKQIDTMIEKDKLAARMEELRHKINIKTEKDFSKAQEAQEVTDRDIEELKRKQAQDKLNKERLERDLKARFEQKKLEILVNEDGHTQTWLTTMDKLRETPKPKKLEPL